MLPLIVAWNIRKNIGSPLLLMKKKVHKAEGSTVADDVSVGCKFLGDRHNQLGRLRTHMVDKYKQVQVVVGGEAMVLVLHYRMMVMKMKMPLDELHHFLDMDSQLVFFLEEVKGVAVPRRQCYNLLFCHRSWDLGQYKPSLRIQDHEM